MKKPLFLLFLTYFTSFSAAAATEEAADRWYEVEVLVFSHEVGEIEDDELWPEVEPPASMAHTIFLAPPPEAAGAEAEIQDEMSSQSGLVTPYQMLRKADLKLDAFDARLARAKDFTPLLHVAWRQPAFPRGTAAPVRIQWAQTTEEASPPPEDEALITPPQMPEVAGETETPMPPSANLSGTLTISANRYLHVDADLYYQPDEPGGEAQGPFNIFDVFSREEAPRTYRMHQSRRMRSGEIHYLDHPRFGVIVQVTPFEYPLKADEEAETVEAAEM